MLRKAQDIFIIFFSALIFLYSLGTPISAHLCQEEIKNLKLFDVAEECNSEEMKCDVHQFSDECEIDHASCCENESTIINFVSFKTLEKTTLSISFNVNFFVNFYWESVEEENICRRHSFNEEYFPPGVHTNKEFITYINIFLC